MAAEDCMREGIFVISFWPGRLKEWSHSTLMRTPGQWFCEAGKPSRYITVILHIRKLKPRKTEAREVYYAMLFPFKFSPNKVRRYLNDNMSKEICLCSQVSG